MKAVAWLFLLVGAAILIWVVTSEDIGGVREWHIHCSDCSTDQ
jgi:hypothetical protein